MPDSVSVLHVVAAGLATWRITHLFHAESGPFGVLDALRARAARLGGVFACFYCLSLWVAIPLAALVPADIPFKLLLWPALSGVAILIERLVPERAAHWEEDPPASDPNEGSA